MRDRQEQNDDVHNQDDRASRICPTSSVADEHELEEGCDGSEKRQDDKNEDSSLKTRKQTTLEKDQK